MVEKLAVQRFIDRGMEIREKEYHTCSASSGIIFPDYISGSLYNQWMNDIKLFTERYLRDYPLYEQIINCYERRKSNSLDKYNTMMSLLGSILEDNELYSINNSDLQKKEYKKKHLFISHSSLDIEYVEPFVRFLSDIGFVGTDYLFCSSISGYNIPMGKKIYDYLKQTMTEDTIVISMLSKNYYNSAGCMNEMGAAWIKSMHQYAILLPGFKYTNLKGAIDASQIWMELAEKDRLNELKDRLFEYFNLKQIDQNVWEKRRDMFIKEILDVAEKYKYVNNNQMVEVESLLDKGDKIVLALRFNNDSRDKVGCSSLTIVFEDKKGNKASVKLSYGDLKDYVLYGNEHRRFLVEVERQRFDNSQFDFNGYRTWSNNASWTTCLD
ncbi:MAG: toll/interleukin-1 receptor domain-containing protein [Lachnospiraceae bacterium]